MRRFDFIQTGEQSHLPQIRDSVGAGVPVVKISLTKPAISKHHVHIVLIVPAIHIDLRRGVEPLPTAAAVGRRTHLACRRLTSTAEPSSSTRLSTSRLTGYKRLQLTSGGRVGPQLLPSSSGFGLDRRNANRRLAGCCSAISRGRFD